MREELKLSSDDVVLDDIERGVQRARLPPGEAEAHHGRGPERGPARGLGLETRLRRREDAPARLLRALGVPSRVIFNSRRRRRRGATPSPRFDPRRRRRWRLRARATPSPRRAHLRPAAPARPHARPPRRAAPHQTRVDARRRSDPRVFTEHYRPSLRARLRRDASRRYWDSNLDELFRDNWMFCGTSGLMAFLIYVDSTTLGHLVGLATKSEV